MISLRVAIMVHAVRLENANVMKGSMVTIAQVNFITCYSRVPNITVGLNKSVGANFSWKLIKK